MTKLTSKQKRFIDEYLIDCNATQAAIRAGYSPKTANEQGSKLLNNARISSYIDEQLEILHSEKMANVQEVLEYLTSVMRGEYTEQVLRLVGNGVQETTTIEVSAKDRIRAAELIGKRYGMFKDNFNVSATQPIIYINDLENLDDDGTIFHSPIELKDKKG